MTHSVAKHIAANTNCSTIWIVEGQLVEHVSQALATKSNYQDFKFTAGSFARKGHQTVFVSKKNNRKMAIILHLKVKISRTEVASKPRARSISESEDWSYYMEELKKI